VKRRKCETITTPWTDRNTMEKDVVVFVTGVRRVHRIVNVLHAPYVTIIPPAARTMPSCCRGRGANARTVSRTDDEKPRDQKKTVKRDAVSTVTERESSTSRVRKTVTETGRRFVFQERRENENASSRPYTAPRYNTRETTHTGFVRLEVKRVLFAWRGRTYLVIMYVQCIWRSCRCVAYCLASPLTRRAHDPRGVRRCRAR